MIANCIGVTFGTPCKRPLAVDDHVRPRQVPKGIDRLEGTPHRGQRSRSPMLMAGRAVIHPDIEIFVNCRPKPKSFEYLPSRSRGTMWLQKGFVGSFEGPSSPRKICPNFGKGFLRNSRSGQDWDPDIRFLDHHSSFQHSVRRMKSIILPSTLRILGRVLMRRGE